MRVAAIQPSFIPWRGYFDFIANVDIFVFLDDVQYTVRDWRNRNKIKTPKGTEWLSVPVQHKSRMQLIRETLIDYSTPWQKKHRGAWAANYGGAPYVSDVLEIISESERDPAITISDLDINLTQRIAHYLGISTPTVLSSDLAINGSKTDRLINILLKLGASTYVSGPSADGYLDKEAFRIHGICLEYKSYDYDPYPQLWGAFDGAVSILDLIANCGPEASRRISSRSPNLVVVDSVELAK